MNFFKTDFISCKPISNLDDLFKWPFESNNKNGCRQFKTEKLLLPNEEASQDANRTKIIVCHDMKNNYLEDKFFQGFDQGAANYSFYHWNLIDIFIYFSHHFITIPPESWINAAHENNCRILGTFITEWDQGKEICKFLDDKNKIDQTIKKLCDITVYYGFDGWLVNIENRIENVENLKYFLLNLTNSLHRLNPTLYKVIWYDSVIDTGELKWQNELNDKNKPFFDLCDAFFVNYTYKEENLLATKMNSAERSKDVYVGVDVFGRNQLGGGGFNCNIAFEIIEKYNLNIALFAPGWLYECHEKEKFIENSEHFWQLLKDYVSKRCVHSIPLVTTFSHGCAKNFYLNGKRVTETNNNGWYNLNLQGFLPTLNESKYLKWHFDDAFYGGNCIYIAPSDEILNIYSLNLNLKTSQSYLFEYVFKILENDSNKGSLELLDEFYMIINYQTKNSSSINSLILGNQNLQNETFVISSQECQNLQESWQRRSFILNVIKDDVKLLDLGIVSKICDIKLGMVRFLDKINEDQKNIIPKYEYKTKIFSLSKKTYFCIDLQWHKFDENIKYYNIFIDEIVENDTTQNIRLIGSSKIEKYSICLNINENFELNPANLSDQSKLNFNIYIQAIDKHLSNIINKDFFAILDNSVVKITLKLNGIHAKNIELKNFFDEIIYDIEFFE